jgi:hypothetical protein
VEGGLPVEQHHIPVLQVTVHDGSHLCVGGGGGVGARQVNLNKLKEKAEGGV